MKIKSTIGALAATFCLGTLSANAALSITAKNSPSIITFDATITNVLNGQYAGAGFQSTPTAGQLDSDAWASTGMSFGALAFGGSQTTDDYARGTTTTA